MTEHATTKRPQHHGNRRRALGAGFWIAFLLLLWVPWAAAADTGPQRVAQYATAVAGELQHPGTIESPFLVDLLAFVTDVDGDLLQVTSGSVQLTAGQGTVTDNGDGTVTYEAPSASYAGTVTIAFQAEEARRPNPVAFTLLLDVGASTTLPPPPSAPIGLTATETAGASGPEVDLQWAAGSADQTFFRVYRAEGAGPFAVLAEPVAAQLTDAAVTAGSSYSYYVTAVNDGGESGASNTAAITLASPPPPRTAPQANNDSFEAIRGQNLTITSAELLANDTDPDVTDPTTDLEIVGYSSAYTVGTLTAIPSTNPTSFVYSAPAGYTGPDSFTYEIRDPGDPPEIPSSTATVSLDVHGHAPVALDKGPFRTEPSTAFVLGFDLLLEGASDPGDSPPDTPFTVVGCAAQGSQGSAITTDVTNQRCVYTPAPAASGTETFTYTIQDSTGEQAQATVSIYVAPPIVANDDGPFTVAQGAELLIDPAVLLANDTAGVEFAGHSSQPAHGTVTFKVTIGKLRYVSDPCWAGPDSFEYSITDGGPAVTGTVNINVTGNRCPVAADDSYQLSQPGPTLTDPGSWVLNVLSNDQDPEQDPLTITHAGGVTQAGAVVEVVNGTSVRYRAPSDTFVGYDQFVYYVSDGNHEVSATVDLTISSAGNQPPQGYAERVSVPYQSYRTFTYSWLLSNDYDPDGDTLSITSIWGPGLNMSCDDVKKRCTITANYGQVGYWTFSYVVSDGRGGTVTVTSRAAIGWTNTAPVAQPDTLETPRDVPLDFFPNSALGANDSDADGDTLTVGAVIAVGGTGSSVSCTQPPVRCTYTPPYGFVGTDTLSYTVTDGELGAWGNVTVQVTPSSNPIAYDDSATVSHPNTVTIPVLANDLDPEGGALTIQTPLSPPAHGSVALAPDGKQIVYTPNASFIGQDSFQYTIVDPTGLTGTGTVTVRVKYNDTILVPLADQFFVYQNETRSINFGYLTSDDWDPDGDPLQVVSVTKKYASAGTMTCDYGGGHCTYTPPINAWGIEESFQYTVTNGSVSKTADLTIYIGTTGGPPAPVGDSFTVNAGSRLWFWAANLVANDVDPDGDGLQVTNVWGASHGTLDCYGNIYKCRYTPDAGYTGPDTLTYRVTDDLHAPVDASIQIEVLP